MKFVPETPDEVLLAEVAILAHEYVLGFLELLKASAMSGEHDLDELLGQMTALAQQRLDRALAQMEVGES